LLLRVGKASIGSNRLAVIEIYYSYLFQFCFALLEYRFSCAAAVGNDTKLDFHGEHRVWKGGTLKKKLVSNKALYVVMEDDQEVQSSY